MSTRFESFYTETITRDDLRIKAISTSKKPDYLFNCGILNETSVNSITLTLNALRIYAPEHNQFSMSKILTRGKYKHWTYLLHFKVCYFPIFF